MADTCRVQIDLGKLAAHLSAAEGKALSEADVRGRLAENDFLPLPGGWWACEEISLRWLDRSEIVAIDRGAHE